MPIDRNNPALNYGGSWAYASKGWPELVFYTDEEARHAHFVAHEHCYIPYGSYVLVDRVLRLETEAYKLKVALYLLDERTKT